jgi:DNA helicase-2/ATP-dependent DNA helicase PcrA
MQFDHAVVVAPEKLSRNDLYVALSRASRTITIVSGTPMLTAKPKQARKDSKA